MSGLNIAIIGASGAIGKALIALLCKEPTTTIYAFSRNNTNYIEKNVISNVIDYDDEESIKNAAALTSRKAPLDYVFVTTGMLHGENCKPEKAFKDINIENLTTIFKANTFLPAIIAKHFIPQLNKKKRSIFAALSARVGSISDNKKGGWYAYRASKSALNMIIKTASIETDRLNPNAIIIGLHPGTVDSPLSKPFQHSIIKKQLFTPMHSAEKLLQVLDTLDKADTCNIFAWNGEQIEP